MASQTKTITNTEGTFKVKVGGAMDKASQKGQKLQPTAPLAPSTPQTPGTPATPTGIEAPTPQAPNLLPQNPQMSTGDATYEQAQKNLLSGGLTGNALLGAQNVLANKYKQGLSTMQSSGGQAPADAGAGRAAAMGATPYEPDTSAVDQFISEDQGVNTLLKGITQLLQPPQQTSTLMQDYKSLYKQSGLDEINEELIDADTVINGTEDDIRNEIQTAGGFGTESQVQAMSLARNKGLLKRYNQLVQMKTDATNQLNTLMSLNAQDKQIAQQKIDSQVSAMFKLADFRQQAVNNVKEQSRWLVQTMGADGLYDAYSQDPRQLSFLEKTLGVAPGGLQSLATKAREEKAFERTFEQAKLDSIYSQIETDKAQRANIYSQIGERDAKNKPVVSTPQQLAQQHAGIEQTNTLLTNTQGLARAVGTSAFGRLSSFLDFGGQKSNFIGDVEQLRSQLSLESLIHAKERGATFGALSEGEMRILSASATKIGTWAVEKDGKVVGYQANEGDFKKELDKINNFAKLDYVLRGGDPTSVGIQQMPDGTFVTQNSDGTYTVF